MKKNYFLLLLSFYVIWFCGCTKDTKSSLSHFFYEEPFKISLEEELFDSNQNVSIKVISVIEDSRCQKDVFCVTDNRIRLEIEFMMDNKTSRHYIIYKKGKEFQKKIEGISIELTQVFPENQIDEEIKLEEYIFTMLAQPI